MTIDHSMTEKDKIKLSGQWRKKLINEFSVEYMHNLKSFLKSEIKNKKTIYPKGDEIFLAFDYTPFEKVKVVILGQDPYHGPHQAHGLCFSVRPGVRVPPSLKNIYKEIQSDVGATPPQHGYLKSWAEQGVLLLNATLSVEAHKAGSHQNKGWEQFTDKAIHALNDSREHLVFMLWGSYAQKKGQFINPKKHFVLKAPHPSPLSAHRGFLGCKHFSKANQYLTKMGVEPIDWNLRPLIS